MLAHKFVQKSVESDQYLKKAKVKKSWWRFGWNNQSFKDEEEQFFSQEDWEQLNKFIGYKEDDNSLSIINVGKVDTLLTSLEVHMNRNASKLTDEAQHCLAELSCEDLNCSIKFFPETKVFHINLGSYQLSSPSGLLAVSAAVRDSLVGVFHYKPFNAKVDWSLVVKASPCYVTYLKDAIEQIISFFESSTAVGQTVALETAAALQLTIDEVKRSAQQQVSRALKDRSRFLLDLDIAAPKITIPAEFHLDDINSIKLLIDLGNLLIRTQGDQENVSPLKNISETANVVPPLKNISAASTDIIEPDTRQVLNGTEPETSEPFSASMKLSVIIDLVQLCLRAGISGDASLATVQASNAWVLYNFNTNGEGFLSATLKGFTVLDDREGTELEFRRAIGVANSIGTAWLHIPTDKHNQLSSDASTIKENISQAVPAMLILDAKFTQWSTFVSLSVQKRQLLVALDFLLAVVEFFVPTVGNILSDEEDKSYLHVTDAVILDQSPYRQLSSKLHISPGKPLVADDENFDHFIYDGNGGVMHLTDRNGVDLSAPSKEAMIYVGNGKKLQFKNITIKEQLCERDQAICKLERKIEDKGLGQGLSSAGTRKRNSNLQVIYEGREPLDVDFCSISIDGNPDNDILQRRLNDIARQREDLQQMEIELRAQVIARSVILEMQKSFDGQMKEHNNAAIKMQTISYMAERVVGTGSFGVVFQAKCLETNEAVAIKKVLQDKRYKNRELQIFPLLAG